MPTFKNYEYEKEELPQPGDAKIWHYRIRNLQTGNRFTYRVKIVGTALVYPRDIPTQIKDAVDTEGESLLTDSLSLNPPTKN